MKYSKTHTSRTDIGFHQDKKHWKKEPAQYEEHSLTISGHPVMEDWEAPYMRRLAEIASSRGGRVLEVGFGMGISAGFLQEHQLTEHVIIEANRDVVKRAHAFAKGAAIPVTILEGLWEEVVEDLEDESFDGILFDTYPLTEEEIHQNHFPFFSEAHRLLKPNGILTYYSDEETDFSEAHRTQLEAAGFSELDGEVVSVSPPKECKYWQAPTLLAPIIQKRGRPYGPHLMLDGYGANPKKLGDVGFIYQILKDLPGQIDMRRVGFPHLIEIDEPEIEGISGFTFIMESHVSIHTYATRQFLTMDVYSCKDFPADPLEAYVVEVFECESVERRIVKRGTRF